MDKFSYAIGLGIGQNLLSMGARELDVNDFAQAIRELSGYDCRVVPCLTGEYPTKARRPHYSVLDKSAIKRAYRLEIPYWRDSLARCIDRMDDCL